MALFKTIFGTAKSTMNSNQFCFFLLCQGY